MPWPPELFSAPELVRFEERRARRYAIVHYFDGLMTGDIDALLGSFAGEPELHHPVRGRVKGAEAFTRLVAETNAWLTEHAAVVENCGLTLTPQRGIEEAIVHLDGGRTALPVAVAADHDRDARLIELRMYFSSWPLSGTHAIRPPLLQPHAGTDDAVVVDAYHQALRAGDVDSVLAAFEPDATVREPAGNGFVHRGTDGLHELYTAFFSNGGGIDLEHCTMTDDGEACALEYNVVGWGRTRLPPQAGIAVYARGSSGRIAAARIYDDCDPPVGR